MNATAEVTSSIGSCSSVNNTATYQLGVCDLRVVAGDRIVVVGRGFFQISPTPAQSTAFIKNVRIYYNVVDATGTGVTLAD